jgi:uroporphyrinogen-III synthase
MDMVDAPQPLSGVSVLLTRARGDNDKLRELFEARGATVWELPTIVIAPPDDWAPLDEALRRIAAYDWLLCTSRNAVRAIGERLLPARLPETLKIAAVGEGTAEAMTALGRAADVVAGDGTAAALLAALLQEGITGKRSLLPQGNLAGPELADGLTAAGAIVDSVVAYRTVMPPMADPRVVAALRDGRVSWLVLASPSALSHLLRLTGLTPADLASVRVACLGPTTAAAVRELSLSEPVVPEERTAESLAEAIELDERRRRRAPIGQVR